MEKSRRLQMPGQRLAYPVRMRSPTWHCENTAGEWQPGPENPLINNHAAHPQSISSVLHNIRYASGPSQKNELNQI